MDEKKLDVEIKQRTLICADIETVYHNLTTAEGLNQWFTIESFVSDTPGGRIYFNWISKRNNITMGSIKDEGIVLEIDPPSIFSFQWHPDGSHYATTVRFELEESPEGTIVQVTEHGFNNTKSGRRAFMGCATGWGEALTLLKFYTEYGLTYTSKNKNEWVSRS